MRLSLVVIPALLAACSATPASTASATDTGTGSSTGATQGAPTTTDAGATEASTDPPTGGSVGMTEGATTTATTTATTGTSGEATGTSGEATGTSSPLGTSTSDETTTGTTTGTSGDASSGDASTGAVEEGCPCPELEVALDDGIFLLSQSAQLWKFFPETKQLALLGQIGCNLPPSTFSMAVDRLGFAWVQYVSGQLRKVDVTNVANCVDPGFVPDQQGVSNFGMAFVSNSAFDACDQIFGCQYTGIDEAPDIADFFRVDPVSLQIVKLGKSSYGTAEVTGTGDGRVFLFAAKNPATQLVEVDRDSGAQLSSTPLPGVQLGGGWAFAFFAGDFYFFTDAQIDGKSEITHIDYDDSDNNGAQDLTVVVQDAPLKVVGAGVSTCAPTIPQ